jgi:hypothetical protein
MVLAGVIHPTNVIRICPVGTSTDDYGMQSAIYEAMSNSTWPRLFSCGSNCTWNGSQPVLGFSSKCNDVSDVTVGTTKCLCEGCPTECEDCLPSKRSNPRASLVGKDSQVSERAANFDFEIESDAAYYCSMTTPNNVTLGLDWFYGGGARTNSPISIVQVQNLLPLVSGVDPGPSDLVRITSWAAAAVNSTITGGPPPPYNMTVFDCTIGFAALEYTNISSDAEAFTIGSTRTVPLSNATWGNGDVTGNDPPSSFYVNWTVDGMPNGAYANKLTVQGIANFFNSTFSGSVSVGIVGAGETDSAAAAIPLAWGRQYPPVVMDRIAASMTNYLQQSKTSQRQNGWVVVPVTLVRVRWVWMVAPLIAEGLGVIFLVTTIFMNSRSRKNIPLWKSSRTVLLHYHLNANGVMCCDVDGPDELDRLDSGILAKLE